MSNFIDRWLNRLDGSPERSEQETISMTALEIFNEAAGKDNKVLVALASTRKSKEYIKFAQQISAELCRLGSKASVCQKPEDAVEGEISLILCQNILTNAESLRNARFCCLAVMFECMNKSITSQVKNIVSLFSDAGIKIIGIIL